MSGRLMNSSRVPGCEHYTRPEEISALSKYLKIIKEVTDDSIEIESSITSNMSDKTGAIVPEISELPLSAVLPESNLDSLVEALPNVPVILESVDKNKIDRLSDFTPRLPDSDKIPEVSLELILEQLQVNDFDEETLIHNSDTAKINDERDVELSGSLEESKLTIEDNTPVSIDLESMRLENVSNISSINSTDKVSLDNLIELSELEIESDKLTVDKNGDTLSSLISDGIRLEKVELEKPIEESISLDKDILYALDKAELTELKSTSIGIGSPPDDVEELNTSALSIEGSINIDNLAKDRLDIIGEVPVEDINGEFKVNRSSNKNPQEQYHVLSTGNSVTTGNGDPISEDVSDLLEKYRDNSVSNLFGVGDRDRGLSVNSEADIIKQVGDIIKNYKNNSTILGGRILEEYRNPETGDLLEYERKLESLLASALNRDDDSFKKYSKLFKDRLRDITEIVKSSLSSAGNNEAHNIPDYKIGSRSWFNLLDATSYVRYIAEESCSLIGLRGTAKELFLSETIALLVLTRDSLEKSKGIYRSQLPRSNNSPNQVLGSALGGDLRDASRKAIKSALSDIGGGIDKSSPINYPDTTTTGWVSGNKRNDSNTTSAEVDFKKSYISGSGIATTLVDLCGVEPDQVTSVEDLYTAFKKSPYITTPGKFTSSEGEGYNNYTLDTNCYWEMIFEPYIGEENGFKSFLPGIHEINILNKAEHGVDTGYNRWIPFLSFDLQKSKLNGKSLGLYDGEIVYPVSVEYLNELRLTIADDQYKSWRRYFETCMDVAVFNSNVHDKNFYSYNPNLPITENLGNYLTIVDKSNQVVGMYKNLAFRCRIFIMTPQKSTIRKYDLLLTLKDFVVEYSGDIDSGGTDLTLAFSVVGENPKGDAPTVEKLNLPTDQISEDFKSKKDYTSIVSGMANSVIKLI